MTNFKQCNRCATECEHRGAIRLCVCGKYTKPINIDLIKCPHCGKQFVRDCADGKS